MYLNIQPQAVGQKLPLLREATKTQGAIVCLTNDDCTRVLQLALDNDLLIGEVITPDKIATTHATGFYFLEAEKYLNSLGTAPLLGLTLTSEPPCKGTPRWKVLALGIIAGHEIPLTSILELIKGFLT